MTLTQRQRDRRFRATPRGKVYVHRDNARKRGISFTLTFAEWWHYWETSGHWAERGNRAGQYQMCRRNDTGPYAAGNVYIAVMEENTRERNRVYGPPNNPDDELPDWVTT